MLINSGNAASARWVQCKLPNYLVEIFATALGAHFLLFIHFKKFYLERTMLIQLLYYNHFLQLAQQLYSTKIFVYKKCCIIMIKIGLAIVQKIHWQNWSSLYVLLMSYKLKTYFFSFLGPFLFHTLHFIICCLQI